MAGLTAYEIYVSLVNGRGPSSLAEAYSTARTEAAREAKRAGRISELAAKIEAGWEGQAGAAAYGAARPIAQVSAIGAENLHLTHDLLEQQTYSFSSARDNVRPIAEKPPETGFLDDISPWDTDTEDKAAQYRDDSEHNVHVYEQYDNQSWDNETSLPMDYAELHDTGDEIDVRKPNEPPRPPRTPGDPGDVTTPPGTGDDRPPTPPLTPPPLGDDRTKPQWVDPTLPQRVDPPVPPPVRPPVPPPTPPNIPPGLPPFPPGVPPRGPSGGGTGRGPGGGTGRGPGGAGVGTGRGPAAGRMGGPGFGAGPNEAGARTAAGLNDPHGQGRGGAAGQGGRGGGAGGMGAGGGARGQGGEDEEHTRASFLQEDDPEAIFGTDQATAPPVIGE